MNILLIAVIIIGIIILINLLIKFLIIENLDKSDSDRKKMTSIEVKVNLILILVIIPYIVKLVEWLINLKALQNILE